MKLKNKEIKKIKNNEIVVGGYCGPKKSPYLFNHP